MTAQIPLSDWPLGLEEDAMVLSLLPTEIERRAPIRFSKDRDELDEFEGAILDLDGHQIALQHYPNSPVSGTNVIRRAGDDAALAELTSLLGLKTTEISWQAPNVRRTRWAVGTVAAAVAGAALAALQIALVKRPHRKASRSSRKDSKLSSRA
jgi:hypothetical protein